MGESPHSVVCSNAIINGYCMLGHMNEAMEIVREMEAKGIKADVVTSGTSGYCKKDDLDRALSQVEQRIGRKRSKAYLG